MKNLLKMANILQKSPVEYVCACGHLNSIAKMYFCRYCLKFRCGFCLCHEVDSHFCSNCLENIPSSEAKLKKNRCNKCFDCPSCQHTLSSRSNTVQTPGGTDGKPISRKMYYLYCQACRWTSRDVGIPDQGSANGMWPEMEYANQTRFLLLLEYYQNIVLQEKQEKQDFWRRKAPKQHKYTSLTDRTGLTASMVRRQIGWSDKTATKTKQSTINPSEATDVVAELPEDIFTKEIILNNVTTLKQRLNNPATQPYTVNNLYPQHKILSIKRSLRCRQCEHNVIKPEYNPASIKYRIQLFASYHVPEVRLVNCESMTAGSQTKFYLKLINPTVHDMTITIMELPTQEEESLIIEEMKKSYERQSTTSLSSMPSLTSTFSRQASLNEEPKFVDQKITGNLILPDSSFVLLRRDDAAEFDEDVPVDRDDPKFVIWRRSNKVVIELLVNPFSDLEHCTDVVTGFSMQYTYVHLSTTVPSVTASVGDKKEPQKHALTSRVYVNLGKLGGLLTK